MSGAQNSVNKIGIIILLYDEKCKNEAIRGHKLLHHIECNLASLVETGELETRLKKLERVIVKTNITDARTLSFIILTLIYEYFNKAMEYQAYDIHASKEVLEQEIEVIEDPRYWIRSWHPSKMLSIEYGKSLLYCKKTWYRLTEDIREEIMKDIFPIPDHAYWGR